MFRPYGSGSAVLLRESSVHLVSVSKLAGEPLLCCIDKSKLHQLHVLHRDAELWNVVYDREKDSLMVVDFERAEIYDRQALQPIDANSIEKRRELLAS
jgi:hypothetical protein